MKKIIPLLCLLPIIVFGQEISIFGNRGMYKLQYARPHNMGVLSFHLAPDWRYENNDVIYEGDHTTDRKHTAHLSGGISYSILDYCETRVRATSFAKYYETSDYPRHREDPTPSWGFETVEFGLKLGYPFDVNKETPVYYAFGIDAYMDLGPDLSTKARADDSLLHVGTYEGVSANWSPYLSHAPDFGFTGLFDFRVGPFAAHLNGGYLITGQDNNPGYITGSAFSQLERPDYIIHGFGIELIPVEAAIILCEIYGLYDTEAGAESLWITPGFRFGSRQISFDVGCEFPLVNESDAKYWKPFFNLSFGFDLIEEVEVHVPIAVVSGRVYDAKSGEPVSATITFPGSDLEPIQTKIDGTYQLSTSPGTYRFHVDAPDYRWKEQGLLLKDGDQIVLDFHLNKKEVIKATITGKVSDAEDGKPLFSQITFLDEKTYTIVTDSATGIYKAIIAPGTYSVKAEAHNYIMESVPIVLAKDETIIQNFSLKKVPKVGEKIVLKGIYFDFNSAVIKPTSYPVLDDAAKVLKAKPKMRVEIGGHTDSVGSNSYNEKLSYRRAQSVKDYLVTYHNIDPWRLDVRGYGESQPIGDNRTRAGRDLNRRIEFRILSVD